MILQFFKKRWKLIVPITLFIIISIIAGSLLILSGPRKPAVIPLGEYSYTIEYVDYQVNKLMKKYDLPSVMVALLDDQEVIYEQAYGFSNIEKKIPATLDTVYKIGSITKLFTGIEIMRMSEEGLIDLDAPINQYLPDFFIKSRFLSSGPITIRSILAHRSGLPRNDNLLQWYWEAHPNIFAAMTNSLADSYQAFPVGYRYKYSNIGYNILGRIIEVMREIEPPSEESAGGWPYYMRDEILLPIGMDNTGFGSDQLLYGRDSELNVAMGYYNENGKNKPYNQFDIINLASGNMQSTMKDMIAFAQYILRIGETDEDQIIRKDTLWSMFEEQYTKPRDPNTNGLAWLTDKKQLGELVVFHDGTNQGVISMIALMPERDLGLIVFSNSDRFEEVKAQFTFDVLKLMRETKYGIEPKQEEPVKKVEISRDILEKYAGKYVINGEIIEIILDGNTAKAIYQGQKISMVPISQSRFRLSHWWADVENIEVEFFVDSPDDEDIMIVTMGDNFICPKYPELQNIPSLWGDLAGEYEIYPMTPSIYSDTEILGTTEIKIIDNILLTTNGKFILPINDKEIIIIGGIFGGETMIYDKITGNILWQNEVYIKK
ncbi:MAG: beta-lactamase family protein [Actinobacteria bacterium]|nr:beta-lactamase family protein [Actinomycetota bacterium]